MVVNAAGVWAGDLADVRLRPSRGSHLVLRGESLPGLRVCVTAPVPGSTSRFVMALPQPDGTVYVGLTDEPVDGPVPDVPEPSEAEVDFLLDVVSATLARPLTRDDVVGAFAGLRPLLDTGGGETADLSRSHAVLTSPDGVVTVVGGKLTTYRRMAQDAVDAALRAAGAGAGHEFGPCRTRRLPLLGAADRATLAGLVASGEADPRLVRRFGTDADLVLRTAREATGLSDARAPGSRSPARTGDPRRAGLRGDPRGRRRRSTTSSTAVPASASSPPTAPSSNPSPAKPFVHSRAG